MFDLRDHVEVIMFLCVTAVDIGVKCKAWQRSLHSLAKFWFVTHYFGGLEFDSQWTKPIEEDINMNGNQNLNVCKKQQINHKHFLNYSKINLTNSINKLQ